MGIRVRQTVEAACHFLDSASFEFKSLWRECDKLQKVDAVNASLMKASLAGLAGDLEGLERWLTNAEQNGGGESVRGTRFAMYSDLGFVTEASKSYRETIANDDSLARLNLTHGIACGSFSEMLQAADRWAKEDTKLEEQDVLRRSAQARDALRALGVPEENVRSMMDRAGELMRARRLLWANLMPDLIASSTPAAHPFFALNYRVDVEPAEAAEMTWALAERLAEDDLIFPFVTVAFVSKQRPAAS
ncbi:MAG TPA: hypothetical protein VFR90_01430 [Methylibium sp.]|uniref:hypothetical protein n=1 Tax=Methylibium sp. TaxID=2067992 RepID=UPI002DBD8BA3|nr:hypothetical protein [Methylibium sp.]HEU4457767.1 hypothetical protein [Methylibium sp.]